MRKLIILAMLALTACKSPQEIAKQEIAQCTELGVVQKDMANCRLQLRAMAEQKALAAAGWSRPVPIYRAY